MYSKLLLTYYPGHEMDAGRIGLLMVICGMLGAVACGFILDRTHRFKYSYIKKIKLILKH